MSDTAVEITVLGRPQPAGSKRAFVNPKTGKAIVTDDAKHSRSWKQEVKTAAAHQAGYQLLEGPLCLEVRFVLVRPKGHWRTGRNAHLLKDSAPAFPVVKPDATKLLRAVEDALTKIIWRDDAQVVHQVVSKVYGEPERCEIRVLDSGAEWPGTGVGG